MNPILALLANEMQQLASLYIPLSYAIGKKKAARRGSIKPWSAKDSAIVELLLIRHAQELQGTMVTLEQGIAEGMTLQDAVNSLLSRVSAWAWVLSPTLAAGLSAGVDENRAEIAEEEGLPVQDIGVLWYTAEDGKVCKRCDYLAGRWFPAKQAYEIAATIHPNAVFAESSFIAYDGLTQIVRSQYRGPSVTVETERVSFAIGPNHPVLTGRGWIKAGKLNKGDYLLYDTRTEESGSIGAKAYLQKMPTIQDVFNSLVSMCGYSTIAAPRVYFHGDEVFCYGKVDVVLPATNLLFVLDSCGLKQFSKGRFPLTHSNKIRLPCFCPSRNCDERVLVPPSSDMSRFSHVESFFGGQSLPSFLVPVRVSHVSPSYYDGWAYDASTVAEVYNSSGIIVKNCRCPAHFDVGTPSEAIVGPIPGYQPGTIDSVFQGLGKIDSRIAKRARLSRAAAAGKPSTYAYPRVNI